MPRCLFNLFVHMLYINTLPSYWELFTHSRNKFNIYDIQYIMLLNFVKLSTLFIKKGSHKQYAMLTTLAVVWALWSFKIFIWSELYWWALKEVRSLQIDQIDIYIYVYVYMSVCVYISISIYIYIIYYFYFVILQNSFIVLPD